MTTITPELKQMLLQFQKNEITEHHIYTRLAKDVRQPENRQVLEKIASDELRHYHGWKKYTQTEVAPDQFKAGLYYWISRLFGFTFGIKLMERGEENAERSYSHLIGKIPEVEEYMREENEHESQLLNMLDEELLRYAGSVVLGLNDALVELTGALAGLTLALQNTQLIALSGSITGIAAALSMGASEYLSTKSEAAAGESRKNPVKAAIYTGIAYIITVLILILPYLFISNYYVCLALALTSAVVIIAIFNYYISVAKDEPFKARFIEMAGLSLIVAAFSFLVGYLARSFLGIEV
jgi:VIT1/CCC1 family predicted Fe2+/Mn2+ transporter